MAMLLQMLTTWNPYKSFSPTAVPISVRPSMVLLISNLLVFPRYSSIRNQSACKIKGISHVRLKEKFRSQHNYPQPVTNEASLTRLLGTVWENVSRAASTPLHSSVKGKSHKYDTAEEECASTRRNTERFPRNRPRRPIAGFPVRYELHLHIEKVKPSQ